jgi:single-strand DNA-binding protein
MAGSLNRCTIIGNLGKDPEIRSVGSGDKVANFSVACTESWKDKGTGEKKEKTEWVNCSAFGKLAEIVGEYVKKGKQVYVAGRMETRKWQDKDGADRYTTEIRVDQLQLLGGKDA